MQAQTNASRVHLLFLGLNEAIQLKKLRLFKLVNTRSIVSYTNLQHLMRQYIVDSQVIEFWHKSIVIIYRHYFCLDFNQPVLRCKLASIRDQVEEHLYDSALVTPDLSVRLYVQILCFDFY